MENVNAAQILRKKKGNLKASRRKSNINEDEAVNCSRAGSTSD
jgi:hypothetical protein